MRLVENKWKVNLGVVTVAPPLFYSVHNICLTKETSCNQVLYQAVQGLVICSPGIAYRALLSSWLARNVTASVCDLCDCQQRAERFSSGSETVPRTSLNVYDSNYELQTVQTVNIRYCIVFNACTYYVWTVSGVNEDLIVCVCFSLHLLWPVCSWSLWLTAGKQDLVVISDKRCTTVKIRYLILKPDLILFMSEHI